MWTLWNNLSNPLSPFRRSPMQFVILFSTNGLVRGLWIFSIFRRHRRVLGLSVLALQTLLVFQGYTWITPIRAYRLLEILLVVHLASYPLVLQSVTGCQPFRWIEGKKQTYEILRVFWNIVPWLKIKINKINFYMMFHKFNKFYQARFPRNPIDVMVFQLPHSQKRRACSTTCLNNVLLFTLFIVVKKKFFNVATPDCGLIHAQQYWTMWAAQWTLY